MQKIFIISLLLFGLMLMTSVSASLDVEPESFDIDLYKGEYYQDEIILFNNFSHSINISISSDLNILFNKTNFILDSKLGDKVKISFFDTVSKSGKIFISYYNGTKNISVDVNVILNSYDNVSIYPDKPYSGKLFVLSLTEDIDIHGFILLDDNIIPVSFKNGFTTVEVEQALYGDAILWLRGKGFVYNFEVLCGIEGTASFSVPEKVTIGDISNIRFSIGGEYIKGVAVILLDPDGYEYSFKTDADGYIKPVMDKTGEWTVKTSFRDKQVISKFQVVHKTLSISIDKTTYNIGDKVSVSFDVDNVDATVRLNNIIVVQQTISDGVLEFIPQDSGSYEIFAKTNDKQGSKSFNVKTPVSIRVLDENNMQTSILRTDKKYIIQVIDGKNNIITDYESISYPYGIINLNNGLGFFTPQNEGTLTLSISDKDNYIGGSLSVTVEQIEQPDNTFIYMGIIITVVIVLLFLLYYLYSVGKISLPSIPKRKGIPDKIL